MFKKYGLIEYPLKVNGKSVNKILKDITTSLKIKTDLVDNAAYFDYYTINDGETFESVAYKYYGDVDKFYLVMLSGHLFDWKDSLPLTQSELEYYVEDTYVNPEGIHHYINSKTKKRTTETEGQFVIPVTNKEYEESVNEEKRFIKLIKAEYSTLIDEMIKGLLNE